MAKETRAVAAAGGGVATKATVSTGARLLTAAKAPIIGLNVMCLGVSMYDIVTASIDLHKKKGCPAGQLLRKLADKLDKLIEPAE